MCWVDIANAYGSVKHGLIQFALGFYHAPPQFLTAINSIYSDLSAIVQTKVWSTTEIPFKIDVFQGDLLSVVVFNTVMNTLIDALSQQLPFGYRYTSAAHCEPSNLLQYADDSCLMSDGPASCQKLLDIFGKWLVWSEMKAKIPKCCCLALKSSTSKPYNPNLSLDGSPIPYIGACSTKFLGIPITLYPDHHKSRNAVYNKLESLLTKVDKSLVFRQQKLHLYSIGICPRLNWDLRAATKLD